MNDIVFALEVLRNASCVITIPADVDIRAVGLKLLGVDSADYIEDHVSVLEKAILGINAPIRVGGGRAAPCNRADAETHGR